MSGVGNIYADEALFRAGVRPRRRAASLTHEDLRRLYLALQEVLQEAISLGGSSVSDYVDADGEEGFFQLQHRVYGREGEPCLVCKTPIKRVVIAGRSSHYCPKCQKVALASVMLPAVERFALYVAGKLRSVQSVTRRNV